MDTEGAYSRWLDGAGATYVITRPDFYVYATAADATELQAQLDKLGQLLHLSAQPALVK